jgi:hypothetical protein
MTLFKYTIENHVLLSAEYTKVLLKNNEGIETIVHELSKKDFGVVSRLCRNLLRNEKTIPVHKNLKQLSKGKGNPYVKSFVSALISGSHAQRDLTSLAKNIVADKRIETDRLIKRLDVISMWLMLIPFVPIILTIIDVFNSTLEIVPQEFGFGFLHISNLFKIGILSAVGAVLIGIVMFLRLRKR